MQFGPNNTANLKGRPRGRPDKRSKHRALFEAAAPEIIQKAIDLAKGGDVDCIRLCLDRVAPKLRDEAPRRRLALDGATLEAQGRAVVAAIAAGELSPDEGAALLTGLARQGELEKLGMIADVVAALAARSGIEVPPELKLRQHLPVTLDANPNERARP